MTNAMPSLDDDQPLATQTAAKIREMLITGELLPGTKLSEQQISAQFGISRNTLREVFRLLTSQSLLTYIPNRGVFVATPDEATVVDIYRVRRVIQKGAVQIAVPAHPALERMNALLEQAVLAQGKGDWRQVGTINMEFHRAMVELCDSTRLSACFDLVLAELRLVFAQLEDNAHLHESYIALNAELLGSLQAGNNEIAAQQLDRYLLSSERSVLAALQRKKRS
ncbi:MULTISPECIES: GntR family transcriptional regulator [Ochrobactrum]|uniref:GntR family transcriptional regulator n=1 Tax=Ochrobactrum chromiisoli TaxID=2993941 RepID=A0ABT3QRL9_9HYPH|nr:GntR family transcriptional regulator [Ochrobactrum chromiisoli]MCX2698253.1 GntR family transcriptional regulator [Ochrobactrum chromiisoli]